MSESTGRALAVRTAQAVTPMPMPMPTPVAPLRPVAALVPARGQPSRLKDRRHGRRLPLTAGRGRVIDLEA